MVDSHRAHSILGKADKTKKCWKENRTVDVTKLWPRQTSPEKERAFKKRPKVEQEPCGRKSRGVSILGRASSQG